MRKTKLLLSIFAILLGPFIIVFSEYDDAPGGILIGILITIIGVVGVWKNKNKKT